MISTSADLIKVSHGSRMAALNYYTLTFAASPSRKPRIYFDYQRDILYQCYIAGPCLCNSIIRSQYFTNMTFHAVISGSRRMREAKWKDLLQNGHLSQIYLTWRANTEGSRTSWFPAEDSERWWMVVGLESLISRLWGEMVVKTCRWRLGKRNKRRNLQLQCIARIVWPVPSGRSRRLGG